MSESEKFSLPVAMDPEARRAFGMHDRVWRGNVYVYPVVSRRSKGLSIGVNLNPDKVCNFDCIYCSVDRKVAGSVKEVDLGRLREELGAMIELARSGEIFRQDPFDKIPAGLRRVNDIAFSGDGEPTTCGEFGEACRVAAELVEGGQWPEVGGKRERVKLVVITNATMFHRAGVREALGFLDGHNGEIWAKLDAGTAGYYDLVDRTAVPFSRVLENIGWCAGVRATVIQTLLMRVHGEAPPVEEISAYVDRLKEIAEGGGKIKLVQLYTVARGTTEAYATALTGEELEGIAGRVREGVAGVGVEVYP